MDLQNDEDVASGMTHPAGIAVKRPSAANRAKAEWFRRAKVKGGAA